MQRLRPMLMSLLTAGPLVAAAPDWAEPMRAVHARFTGTPGTFAQLGDSITVTLAYFTPLLYARKNASPELEAAFGRVKAYLRPECWREWKGPEFGSDGGKTAAWACEHIDAWLAKLNPEVALIMFGTNDLGGVEVEAYAAAMRAVIQKCLDRGTVVILSTIPPRSGAERKAAAFAEAVRGIVRDLHVPLIDYHGEIMRRRPDDWDGTLAKFSAWEGYDVPTLISRDGVHPSNPPAFRDDYSEEGLRSSGYGLRSALTLLAYDEVIRTLGAEGGEKERAHAGDASSPPSGASPGLPPSTERGDGRGDSEDAGARGARSAGGARAGEARALPRWFPRAPSLPPPAGEIVRAGNVAALLEAAARARPGVTIMVDKGTYELPRRLDLAVDRITLRGATGNPDDVVLDGGAAGLGELVAITRGAAGVTIADLTIRNVRWNGFKIDSETGVQRLTIRNCVMRNIWQRAIKGVKVPREGREKLRPSGCRVEYCLFCNDRPKTFADDASDTAENFGGNYIGGIDVMYARDWVIRHNVFIGIRGRTGEARGAVFLWHEAEGCVVERNVIVDCDSGICLGNSSKPDDVRIHAVGCIVRNNFLARTPENGILADYTERCKILHNTVHDPKSRLGRLIRLVHANDGMLVANNLLDGPAPSNESASAIEFRDNLTGSRGAWFVDAAGGDLHLKANTDGARGAARRLPDAPDDIDGAARGERPAAGADEP